MKFAIWIYTVAVALTSLAIVAVGGPLKNLFKDMLGDKPLPNLTNFFLHFQWPASVCILMALGVAIWLSTGRRLTPDRAFAFAGVSTLFIVGLLLLAAHFLSFPFFHICVVQGS